MRNQYRTIESGAGYVDQRNRGRIRVSGTDAVSFLQALVSNDVAGLAPARGCYATYLTPQGRMLADFDVLRRPDGLWLSLAPGQLPGLVERLDALIFAEDVQIADVSAEWAEWAVLGRTAVTALSSAFGLDAQALERLEDLSQLDLPRGFVSRATDVGFPMFRVLVPASERDEATLRLARHAVEPIGADLFESLRIEHGRPRWSADLDGEAIPLEAGLLERAISTTKGCYVGQEIVIRILHRKGGRVARRLVRLAFGDEVTTPPAPGSVFVADDGSTAGRVTSVSRSPTRPGFIGLGYVSWALAQPGTRVRVGETGATATVTGLAG